LPINWGVTLNPRPKHSPGDDAESSQSFNGSQPAFAATKGVTASLNPAASIAFAKTRRKHLIVTPRNGASTTGTLEREYAVI
jgi:hypothetical protein